MKTKSVLINALIILGKTQCKQGNFEESLTTIEKALEYDPQNKELKSLQEKIKEIFANSLETESEKVPDRYLQYLDPGKEKNKLSDILFPKPKPKKVQKKKAKPKKIEKKVAVKKEEKPKIAEKPVEPEVIKKEKTEKPPQPAPQKTKPPAAEISPKKEPFPAAIAGAVGLVLVILIVGFISIKTLKGKAKPETVKETVAAKAPAPSQPEQIAVKPPPATKVAAKVEKEIPVDSVKKETEAPKHEPKTEKVKTKKVEIGRIEKIKPAEQVKQPPLEIERPETQEKAKPQGVEEVIKEQIARELSGSESGEIKLAEKLFTSDTELALISLFHVLTYCDTKAKEKATNTLVEYLSSHSLILNLRLFTNLMSTIQTQEQQMIIDAVTKKAKDDLNNSKARCALGTVYLALGFQNEASSSFLEAIKLDVNNIDAYIGIGIICAKKSAYEKAFLCWKKIESKINNKKYPNIASALYHAKNKQPDEAAACCKKEIDLNPEQAQRLITLGQLASGQQLYLESIANYKKAIEMDPGNCKIFYLMGTAHISKKITDEAKICFRHVFLLNPQYTEGYNALGVAYMVKGKSEIAKNIWEAIYYSGPDKDIAKYAKNNLEKLPDWESVPLGSFKF
jgi:tetratricopeptide (TPR) repeat protein